MQEINTSDSLVTISAKANHHDSRNFIATALTSLYLKNIDKNITLKIEELENESSNSVVAMPICFKITNLNDITKFCMYMRSIGYYKAKVEISFSNTLFLIPIEKKRNSCNANNVNLILNVKEAVFDYFLESIAALPFYDDNIAYISLLYACKHNDKKYESCGYGKIKSRISFSKFCDLENLILTLQNAHKNMLSSDTDFVMMFTIVCNDNSEKNFDILYEKK